MTFYQKYVALCTERGEKPSPAAQKMGISKTTVNRWKKGGGATDASLQTIANYFNVSVEYLKEDEADEQKKVTAQGGDLSDYDSALLTWFHSLPEEKRRAILIAQDAPKELLD